ncbi:unnamed protein product [Prunus brigantina]
MLKLRLFGNSLSGQAFTWYTNLPANSVQTWEQMESVFHDYYYRIQPEVTISDLAALKQNFITRFRKLKMKCRIPMKERHFIPMAQAALKISLRKRFDGMLFVDLAELADKASKYEELLREEQQKRNSSKGTYYKSHSPSIHMIEVESEEDAEGSYKASKRSEAATIHRRVCSKQTDTEQGIIAGRLKLAEKPPSVTTDLFPPPQVNMVNLNWLEQKRGRPATEASSSRSKIVSKETIERPKATISTGIVLCSKCKCEAELEVVLDRPDWNHIP